PLRARHEAPCLVGLGGDVDRLFRVALVGVGEAADEVGDVGGVAVLERSGGAGGDPFPCNPVSMDGRRRGHVDTFLSRAGQLDGDGGAVPPLMSMRPVNRAPSPMTSSSPRSSPWNRIFGPMKDERESGSSGPGGAGPPLFPKIAICAPAS